MVFLKPELDIPDTHLRGDKADSKILHPCYCTVCIASILTLHFDLYKLPQAFHLVHTDDEVLIRVLGSPVLDMRQFNQVVLVKRLSGRACEAPRGQKPG